MNTGDAWSAFCNYMAEPPTLTLEWNDAPTGARGWLVLNSLRGGAAGGGTRMRKGVTLEEVTHLAKTMELKFAFSGPPIGGAKSGIDFDPEDPRKDEVLGRWFQAIRPYLESCYGTAGDVGVDEQREVVRHCRVLGLEHPQQGIVAGYLRPGFQGLRPVHRRLRAGLALPVTSPGLAVPGAGGDFRVSDLITGYGAARAAVRLLEASRGTAEGVRVVVEGFGNVGGAAALYLARMGLVVVGITDAHAGVLAPDGLELREVEELLRRRQGRTLPPHPARVTGSRREGVYEVAADLFIPAAVSGSVDAHRLDQLEEAGVETIVCAANQPFREGDSGSSGLLMAADNRFTVLLDAVASMGMARCFHHLMVDGGGVSDEELFEDVALQMESTVTRVLDVALDRGTGVRGLAAAAVEEALRRLGAGDQRVQRSTTAP